MYRSVLLDGVHLASPYEKMPPSDATGQQPRPSPTGPPPPAAPVPDRRLRSPCPASTTPAPDLVESSTASDRVRML